MDTDGTASAEGIVMPPIMGPIPYLSSSAVRDGLSQGTVLLMDVRPVRDIVKRAIIGAQPYEEGVALSDAAKGGGAKTLVLYCDQGRYRSVQVAEGLRTRGVAASVLQGGMSGWMAQGYGTG
ncbi:hypothetical protein KIPB_011382 [Kipferlia bialata]|uniref:Rhodanese domain-containing protein n=1 Tax=Kipferlia bialata TaxID=797122 RepID=A0A391NZG3_9EUKA|nr:hypothetical protein KIPB_011382 [Kipferlia bialata]|eukprot:g11382.t1